MVMGGKFGCSECLQSRFSLSTPLSTRGFTRGFNPFFLLNRLVGALFVIGWNIVWTSLILIFIKYVLRIPLRMTEEELLIGDDMIHGEAAYVFGDPLTGSNTNREVESSPVTMGMDPSNHGGGESSGGSGVGEVKHD